MVEKYWTILHTILSKTGSRTLEILRESYRQNVLYQGLVIINSRKEGRTSGRCGEHSERHFTTEMLKQLRCIVWWRWIKDWLSKSFVIRWAFPHESNHTYIRFRNESSLFHSFWYQSIRNITWSWLLICFSGQKSMQTFEYHHNKWWIVYIWLPSWN